MLNALQDTTTVGKSVSPSIPFVELTIQPELVHPVILLTVLRELDVSLPQLKIQTARFLVLTVFAKNALEAIS